MYVFVVDPFEKRKRDARRALAEAIFDGHLKPPTHCPRCGEHTVVTGHHFDYRRPLDVHWLCYWCHFCEHQKQLGLPVSEHRRSPIPTYRAPRTRKPSKRPGRPRNVDRYTRERPISKPRTYGQYLGQPVVRRNGRPALRIPQHPLARGGFVYVEELLLFEQLGRRRQIGDAIMFRDGNRWNWDPRNVVIQTLSGDPHVQISIMRGRNADCVSLTPVDIPASVEARIQTVMHEGHPGFLRAGRTWSPQEAKRIVTILVSWGISLRVQDLRRSIVNATISDRLPSDW